MTFTLWAKDIDSMIFITTQLRFQGQPFEALEDDSEHGAWKINLLGR